jgi:hypothetical protein
MDLKGVAEEVDDPVIRDTGASVEACLVLVVDPVRRFSDFHDENGAGRMRVPVRTGIARDHGHVGLWL